MSALIQTADEIRYLTRYRADGSAYAIARLWIAGVPFQTDLRPQIERTISRLAAEHGLEVQDWRLDEPAKAQEAPV